MKRMPLLFLMVLLFTCTGYAQTKLAPNLMQWMHQHELAQQNSQYAHTLRKGEMAPIVSLLIKVNKEVDETHMQALGAKVGTKAGQIWTIRIPANNLPQFTRLSGMEYMEIAQTVTRQIDSAKYFTHVDSVHQGIDLAGPLSGKGVVVGLIDDGFDYTNPAFYDTSYNTYRVSRAWVQDTTGTPPAGYTYGAEYKGEVAILQKQVDAFTRGSHGNTCADIAAGSGVGSTNPRAGRGMAYESELVFVTTPYTYLDWRALNMASIIDGIQYIFNYAQSVGKPAVINISLGSILGARDGGSLFAQACDNLTGPGKIVVVGAMNTRTFKCHIAKNFPSADTSVNTIIGIQAIQNGQKRNYIDAWGDSAKTFCLRFGMYRNGTVVNYSAKYCMDNSTKNFYMVGSDLDTCYITLTTVQQDYNKKPHATIDIYTKSNDSLCISTYSDTGTVHMWQEYFDESWYTYWGEFIGNGTWAQGGDVNYAIGEMACTKSLIAVGAYVSRVYWKNLNNQTYYGQNNGNRQGMLTNFSSKGPSIDGRIKPEITAPGGMINGAVSSFDKDAMPGGGSAPFLVSKYTSPKNGRTYYHASGAGTSFAAPVVSGVVAMMLQVSPGLSPDRIKSIISRTATRDQFTTANPDSSLWGAGKLNAYAAVKEAIIYAGTVSVPKDEKKVNLFPNPSQGAFSLEYNSSQSGYMLVEVSNALGGNIQTHSWLLGKGNNQLDLDMSGHPKGIYFVTISGQGGQVVKRFVVQ